MVRIRVTARTGRPRHRVRYIVITRRGLQFVEKWYTVAHIPPRLTRRYQFLLKLIWMKGSMPTTVTTRLGYGNEVVKQTRAEGYVEVENRPPSLPAAIRNTIDAMIGEAPREIYA